MKKLLPEATDSKNLEEKFDQGQEVLDYFDVGRAQVIAPSKSRGNLRRDEPGKTAVVREDAAAWNKYGETSSVRVKGDTGKGTRMGAVTARTQVKNPKTGDWTKRDETPGSPKKGQFMDVKSDGKKFKGVAKEPDKRRK